MKKGSVDKKQIKELDQLWAKRVKEMFGNKCFWCGGTNRLAADHIFSRKVYSTRWQLSNGIALCCGCHIFKKKYEPMEWALLVLDKKGFQAIKLLQQQHHDKTAIDYKQIKAYLEEKYEDIPYN